MRPTPGWVPKALEFLGQNTDPDAVFVNERMLPFDIPAPIAVDPETYKIWGVPLYAPAYGGICVFQDGGPVVGFCVGRSNDNKIAVLRSDGAGLVGVKMIPYADIEAWRWPFIVRIPFLYPLPLWTGPVVS